MGNPDWMISGAQLAVMRFEQALIAVQDADRYASLTGAIQKAFAEEEVETFLRSVKRARLLIRNFEGILAAGLLGRESASKYGALVDSDKGLIREFYLRAVEKVARPLREKYLKVYAYYA
jgi:hypothetical protein